MSDYGLHPERALRREVLAPFYFTAPIALVVAGAILLGSGGLALSTHWSSLTVSVTHLGTLGLLTMACVALLYGLLAVEADGEGPGLPVAHGIYYLLLAGTIGLVWGTARSSALAVFFSVGAMGLMGVAWLVHASLALRRASDRGTIFDALRLSLLGFFLVASLGIWLGHGYGGMQFPGSRPLWLQVHLCIGLTGWVGAVLMAVSWRVVPLLYGGISVDSRVADALHRGVLIGIVLPSAWLMADYFGLLGTGDWDRAPGAALLTLPALVAVWGVHPFVALASVRGRPAEPGLLIWRTALGLGPFTLLAAVAAYALDDARFALLFGWLAIFGWAGLAVHALLLRVAPFLIEPLLHEDADGRLWTASRIPDTWLHLSFALHLIALVAGALGIISRSDALARIAGLAMVGLGVVLLVSYIRAARRPRLPISVA